MSRLVWLVCMNGNPPRTVRQDALSRTYDAVLDALGDPTRRAILERLRDGPKPVVEIARGLPVGRPAVSQHLKVLKQAGLVIDRPKGTRRIYGVDPDGMASLRDYAQSFWSAALTRYARAAERTHQANAGDASGKGDGS
jgi:DNA-binding transcriptional ArsR family regulator